MTATAPQMTATAPQMAATAPQMTAIDHREYVRGTADDSADYPAFTRRLPACGTLMLRPAALPRLGRRPLRVGQRASENCSGACMLHLPNSSGVLFRRGQVVRQWTLDPR